MSFAPNDQVVPASQRAMKRAEDRAKTKREPEVLTEVQKAAVAAENFLKSMLVRFQEQYNGFLQHAPYSPATQISMALSVSEIFMKEDELRSSLSGVPEDLITRALRDEKDPNQIKVTYLRVEKTSYLKAGHKIIARPGVPESVAGDMHTTLLYHAAVILTNSQKEELEIAAAKKKLIDELIEHLFISGVQHQEMSNEKQWHMDMQMQQSGLKEKAQEAADMFSKAADMKVNKTETKSEVEA